MPHRDSYGVVDSVTIRGYPFSDDLGRKQKVFFQTCFSVPLRMYKWIRLLILKDNLPMGTAYMLPGLISSTKKDEQIIVSTAISGVSMEGVAKNLQAEVPEKRFEKVSVAGLRKHGMGNCRR